MMCVLRQAAEETGSVVGGGPNILEEEDVKHDVGLAGWTVLVVALWALVLGGCAKPKAHAPEGVAGEAVGGEEPLETPAAEVGKIMEGRTSAPLLPIYFDFDSSVIRDDQVERLEHNGAYLKAHPEYRVRIEGNCDPRGTREYNLALGERRAQSAKKYLIRLGVDPERIATVSWGEEKLLLHGHDELSWAQNRRDDFVLLPAGE